MKQCPICRSDVSDDIVMCECGYDFSEEEIGDQGKLLAHYTAVKKSDWCEEVRLVQRIHKIQCKKYGSALPGPGPGWRQSDTAQLLGISNASISNYRELSHEVEENPDICYFKKKPSPARLKEWKKSQSLPRFESEDDLQKHLQENWEKTELSQDWTLYKKGKVNTGEVGEMDLLTRHKKEPRWLVIELKKDPSSDNAVGQLLRYMGWVRWNLATGKEERVEGLIISKDATLEICYALSFFVSNVELFCYRWNAGGLELERINPKAAISNLKGLDARHLLKTKGLDDIQIDQILNPESSQG